MEAINRAIIVAPMMGCTDRHCRKLFRLISPHSFLFTEMVVTGALIHGEAQHYLQHEGDDPCALQLGGNNPTDLAICAELGQAAGYQEINLNVGCPSDRVQHGGIGACLMAKPDLVAECIAAMQAKVAIPVTIKCRIGIDNQDSYEEFARFIETVSRGGCEIFYVHARKAILSGLSPKENREIPPLRYDYVQRIQTDFPACQFYLNGGIGSVQACIEQLKTFPGVMMGRAPYKHPYMLAEVEKEIFGYEPLDRFQVVDAYLEYVARQPEPVKHSVRHLLGLFLGLPGARQFRRQLSTQMFREDASIDIVTHAMTAVSL